MKIEKNTVGGCRLSFSVVIDENDSKKLFKNVQTAFAKEATVPGFRQGKAPWAKIEKAYKNQYQKSLSEEAVRNMIEKCRSEYKDVNIYSIVDVKNLKLEPNEVSGELIVDVLPTVDVPDLSKISIKPADVAVSDEELTDFINRVRGMMSTFEDAKGEDVITENDLVSIGYTSNWNDRKPVEDATKHWLQETEFWFQLHEDAFIPGIAGALLGKKSGEKVMLTADYPADFKQTDLAGEKVDYSITVTKIRKQVPATDEMIFNRVGAKSMEELKTMMTANIANSKENQERARVREDLIAALIDSVPAFDLPESAVTDETNVAVQHLISSIENVSEEEIKQHRDEILETAKKSAERTLRLRYILAAIVKDRKLTPEKDEFSSFVDAQAAAAGLKSSEYIKRVQQNRRLSDVYDAFLSTKMLDILTKELVK